MTHSPKHKIPDEALPVVRDALRMQVLSALQELHSCVEAGAALAWEPLDTALALLRELEDDGEVTSGNVLLEALRRQLDTERYLADTHDQQQRGRALMMAEAITAVLDLIST